jgi:hypothetical protein
MITKPFAVVGLSPAGSQKVSQKRAGKIQISARWYVDCNGSLLIPGITYD